MIILYSYLFIDIYHSGFKHILLDIVISHYHPYAVLRNSVLFDTKFSKHVLNG